MECIKQNISNLNVNIDSIFIENNGLIDKMFYNNECLHESRSCSKLLVAMTVGIVIENGILVNGYKEYLDWIEEETK